MLFFISKKEQKMNELKLQEFCKNNHCLMYNFMNEVISIRMEAVRDREALEKRKHELEFENYQLKKKLLQSYKRCEKKNGACKR
jgi:type IV secretory pathway VirB4 component